MPSVESHGASIYYETHGDAARPPLLLLMGLGTDAHGWEPQLSDFGARHRVILVDNRGVGRSSKPAGPYSTRLLADDARAVLDALAAPRAHVLGLSMGGMIAQELALASPERVGALALAVTYARPGREVEATSGPGIPSPLELLAGGAGPGFDLASIDLRQIMGFLMPMVFSPRFLVDNKAMLEENFQRSLAYGFSMAGFLGQVAAAMGHDTVARLPSLALPTLVITGTADALVPPRHSDELARLIPGARLEKFEGIPHGINFEAPERFNTLVLEFLADHPL